MTIVAKKQSLAEVGKTEPHLADLVAGIVEDRMDRMDCGDRDRKPS
jgi:hypothetical protein